MRLEDIIGTGILNAITGEEKTMSVSQKQFGQYVVKFVSLDTEYECAVFLPWENDWEFVHNWDVEINGKKYNVVDSDDQTPWEISAEDISDEDEELTAWAEENGEDIVNWLREIPETSEKESEILLREDEYEHIPEWCQENWRQDEDGDWIEIESDE